MNNRVAHNVYVPNLISVLSDMLAKGSNYVDIMIDDELTIRIRTSPKELEDKKDEGIEWIDPEDII